MAVDGEGARDDDAVSFSSDVDEPGLDADIDADDIAALLDEFATEVVADILPLPPLFLRILRIARIFRCISLVVLKGTPTAGKSNPRPLPSSARALPRRARG